MKLFKNILVIGVLVIFSNFSLLAQIKLNTKKQVHIGEESADAAGVIAASLDTVTRLKIFGPFGGDWRAGGRVSFGDQASRYNLNVMIGELGTEDCDKLWLHGKYGTYITSGAHAEDTIAYYDADKGNFYKFNCDVKADGIFVSSDERFKDNINPLESSLSSLSEIVPVTYNLKPRFTNKMSRSRGAMSEKDRRDQAFFDKFYNDIANDSLRFGFLAQDVKEIFPELVRTDKDGYMYVDYIGMIPVLVNAINELKGQLDNVLTNKVRTLGAEASLASSEEIETSLIVPKLYQNAPNPFSEVTEIRFALPEECENACIYIYNMQGTQIRKYEVAERGESSLQINASDLEAGMYIYALIADGVEIDSKRMILTR